MRRRNIIILFVCVLAAFAFWGWLYTQYSVPILMYHSFDKSRIGSYAAVSLDTFSKQMEYIKRRGYSVISLKEYCTMLKLKQRIGHNLVVITSDDGYKDNFEAIKILAQYNFPATIFVVVDNIDTPDHLTAGQIQWFLKNTAVGVGSHTMSHQYLALQDDTTLTYEITASKHALESLFNYKVDTLAYPIGGFDENAIRKVKQSGYVCACSTNRGYSRKQNLYALRRIKITERDSGISLWAKLSGFYTAFKKVKKPY